MTPVRFPLIALCMLAVLAAFPSFLTAQATFFVNGQTGVDTPSAGTSPQSPWKTVGYAMANVPTITNPNTSGIIYVEGNQAYSPSTNGESFPITPAYNYALEGTFVGHGVMPVFRASPNETMFAFDPQQFYNRSQVTFRYLVFEGGHVALEMGSDPGFRHRPQVQECTFRGQTFASVRIRNSGQSIEDPRFFQNRFEGGPSHAIFIAAWNDGAVVQPQIDENEFGAHGIASLYLLDASPNGGNVGMNCQFNTFRGSQGSTAIMTESAAGAATTNLTVRRCTFDGHGLGIDMLMNRPVDPVLLVEDSLFTSCGTAVRMRGQPLAGPYSITARRNAFVDCTSGITAAFNNPGAGVNLAVLSEGNLYRNAGRSSGTALGMSAPTTQMTASLRSRRDVIRGFRTGIEAVSRAAGSVAIESTIIANCETCLGLDVASATTSLQHLTIADGTTGLQLRATQGPLASAEGLIFDGNASDVANASATAFAPTYSCFSGSSFAGVGNLAFTTAQLARPFYKLRQGSPCIDAANIGTSVVLDYEGDPRASVSRPGGPPSPDMGADEYVQVGSVRTYGVSGIGAFNISPSISSPQSDAKIGQSLQIDLGGASFAQFAALIFGVRDDSGALPFHLAGLGFPNVYLWTDYADAVTLIPVSGSGSASHVESIPGLGRLIGETFTYQWLCLTPVHPGVLSTNGLRVTVGQ